MAIQEKLWNMLADGNSAFYTSLRGNGFIKWESGCFVNFNMSALEYKQLLLLSFFDEEFTDVTGLITFALIGSSV